MRVLVTGGSGFTGKRVTALLVDKGHEVLALARSDAAAATVEASGALALRGDLDDPAAMDTAFRAARADALLNIASLGFGHAGAIVAAAEDAGIGRATFVSTTAVTTTLAAPSRKVRLEAEAQIRESDLDWTIVRPTMIYGAGDDRNMARLLLALGRLPAFPLPGGGRGLQQPVHVLDLAEAIVATLDAPGSIGRTYDIAGPEALTFRQVVETAAAAIGRHPRLVGVPLYAVVAATSLYARLSRRPRVTTEQIQRLGEDKTFDIVPARNDLGYAPRSFEEGIRAEAMALQ